MAAALVLDRELDALVRDRLDQFPAALAHLLDVRRPGQLGADARRRAGQFEIRLRVAQCQGVPVREAAQAVDGVERSEEHTSELQSLMRISYAVFCLTQKKTYHNII